MIRRVLVQSDAHKAPQRQRVRQPPGNPALRPDALEIPDQQRPKVNPRRQRRTPVLGRIELRTPLLDKLVEVLGLEQFIQALIKRMSRRRRQLRVRDPDVLLLLPLLARPHRHAPILRTKSVDTSEVFVYESGLAPRAPRAQRRESCELSFSSRKQKCPEGSGLLFSPLLRLCRLCRRGPYGSAGDLGFCFEPIFYVMAVFT